MALRLAQRKYEWLLQGRYLESVEDGFWPVTARRGHHGRPSTRVGPEAARGVSFAAISQAIRSRQGLAARCL
jgi:hypothetical protein